MLPCVQTRKAVRATQARLASGSRAGALPTTGRRKSKLFFL